MTGNMLIVLKGLKYAEQVSCIPLNMDMCESQNKANYRQETENLDVRDSALGGNAKVFSCNLNSDLHS